MLPPCRLVMEKEGIVLYHSLHNSRLYHEKDPIGIEISEDVCRNAFGCCI